MRADANRFCSDSVSLIAGLARLPSTDISGNVVSGGGVDGVEGIDGVEEIDGVNGVDGVDAGLSGRTMVPMPESVKISSRTAWLRRPSRTWACGTPPRTAVRHASILGIIPAES